MIDLVCFFVSYLIKIMNNSLIKMKKYLLYFVAAAMITACNGDWMDEMQVRHGAQAIDNVVNKSLMEQAKQGDVNACLKMAQRYHDGVGVRKDILMMRYMLLMAQKHSGREIADSFYTALPENDEARLYYEAIENINHDVRIKTLERIYNEGLLPEKLIKAVEACINGEEENGRLLLKEAAEEGSQFALVLLLARAYNHGDAKQTETDLGQFVDKYPFIQGILNDINADIDIQ